MDFGIRSRHQPHLLQLNKRLLLDSDIRHFTFNQYVIQSRQDPFWSMETPHMDFGIRSRHQPHLLQLNKRLLDSDIRHFTFNQDVTQSRQDPFWSMDIFSHHCLKSTLFQISVLQCRKKEIVTEPS
ncbi:hypothetical protein AVEN_207994-1 [Araneus ventricosus]|uniref:Uncharacterized protein n=1 Tax=Araneus ventricosus TaxID=182803 RepID=A0A4Y2J7T0_ARAVE|nr:hypothetical protein AVEN_207994-1 [Araneus ventricosus]